MGGQNKMFKMFSLSGINFVTLYSILISFYKFLLSVVIYIVIPLADTSTRSFCKPLLGIFSSELSQSLLSF